MSDQGDVKEWVIRGIYVSNTSGGIGPESAYKLLAKEGWTFEDTAKGIICTKMAHATGGKTGAQPVLMRIRVGHGVIRYTDYAPAE